MTPAIAWLRRLGARALWLFALAAAACAPRTPPAAPVPITWRQPGVPGELTSMAAITRRYEQAWARIRGGDARAGERELGALLKTAPAFYPATASLGELRLHRQQYREAASLFSQALAANARYAPALLGLVDARLGAGDDPGALTALEAWLATDPNDTSASERRDVVRLRVSQSELALAERLRAAGQMDDAERHLQKALEATPENAAVLRSLAAVSLARGTLEAAEARARQAVALDSEDAASLAVLGDVLEAQGRYRDAAAAYARVVGLDPRPVRRERLAALLLKAEAAALPEGYRLIEAAPSVTRAQVAAVLGVRLAALLERAPARSSQVVTDVRGHWAVQWILPVVRAGWIDARPNHTFDPPAAVRRAEMAQIAVAVLDAAAAGRRGVADGPAAATRVVFADVPRDHVAFRAAALAVSAGIMAVDANNRFQPAGAVSGSELFAIVARLEARAR